MSDFADYLYGQAVDAWAGQSAKRGDLLADAAFEARQWSDEYLREEQGR